MRRCEMKIQDYEKFVNQMISKASTKDFQSKIGVSGLGLAGESGEVADIAKKILFHEMEYTQEVKDKLVKEAGDVIFYLTFLCTNVLEMSLEDVMEANKEKLLDRYKSGKFTVQEFMDKESKK